MKKPNIQTKNYQAANVQTTDQGKLIMICYDVAINSLNQALDFMKAGKLVQKSKKIYKAQDAVTELIVSLNVEKGGEFAKRLFSLYDYFNWRLSEANNKQDAGMITEVLNHLKSLREAWLVAIDKVRKDGTVDLNPDTNAPLKLVG